MDDWAASSRSTPREGSRALQPRTWLRDGRYDDEHAARPMGLRARKKKPPSFEAYADLLRAHLRRDGKPIPDESVIRRFYDDRVANVCG